MAKVGRRELTVGYIMEIDGEWCFYREVAKSRDLFRRFSAWSIQANVMPVLEEDAINWIYLWEKEGKELSRISLQDFKRKSVERNFGAGVQLYVSAKYFTPLPGKGRPKDRYINSVELVA